MVAPAAPGARLGHVAKSRGVLLLGHEYDRLAASLAEFEPASGLVVLSVTASAPEFGAEARTRNASFSPGGVIVTSRIHRSWCRVPRHSG